MKKIRMPFLSAMTLGVAIAACSSVSAQPETILDGVYTEEQAELGQPIYEQRCSACHNADFYANSFNNRNSQPLAYLFEEILVNMPADMPSSLMDHEYEQVLAHILSLVGYPAGDQELNYANGTMFEIQIAPPPES
ncbi:hypothetical protein GCM10011403_22590 [Pseudohongiella nitratireducens]|jgi:mono/diheme cytochrome c family protein|uniref:Cytochrome c domain-containing protein n=1 Tax=Pseudohongiella nitratireducens TaxID=1768907 RepID=A0A916QK77_9GAMM|nr:cytochrome c [Pseudohongiella nitratireducens]MDF1623037.1 cytochrome c [Pseudohongiella nitratireducens]GFZ78919.1 hypothetical protein GCM10011403_22590 [Pseudohongiella nitratireducens]|tara:strand:- start:6129 stop:6536 length:408 start_codon:yes stop_codon:yes gene_type:complete